MPRIIHLVNEVMKIPIIWMVENVASMKDSDLVAISDLLGVKPYRACPSDFGEIARPRFFWLSYNLDACEYLSITEKKLFYGVTLLGHRSPTNSWIETGWHRRSECCMHTLTLQRRRTEAPFRPAGLHKLTSWERSCWQEAKYCKPPYQFQTKFLLFSDKLLDSSRLLCANEAERLH